MTPSESFQTAIQSYDRNLSIRAAKYFPGKWVVEHEGYIPPFEVEYLRRRRDRIQKIAATKPAKEKEKLIALHNQVAEEFESARNRKRVVIITDTLNRKTFDAIALGDVQRYGGYSRFLDEVEKQEKAAEAQREADFARMRDENHTEAHSMLNYAFRRKESKLMHYDGRQKLSELVR